MILFLKAWSIDLLIYSLSRLRAHFHVHPTIKVTEILGILALILNSWIKIYHNLNTHLKIFFWEKICIGAMQNPPDFSYMSVVHQQIVFSVISFRTLLFLKLLVKGTFTKRFRRDNVFMPGFNGFLISAFDWWQKQFVVK